VTYSLIFNSSISGEGDLDEGDDQIRSMRIFRFAECSGQVVDVIGVLRDTSSNRAQADTGFKGAFYHVIVGVITGTIFSNAREVG